MKYCHNYANVKSVAGNKLTAVASTGRLDRDNEIVMPSAFLSHLVTYRRNPVILATHSHRNDSGSPTIIGRADSIAVKNSQLVFSMTFAPTRVGQEWQTLYEKQFARSFSIGFIPIEGEYDPRRQAYIHTEVELLEISAVAVPANVDAVVTGKEHGAKRGPALADELETLAADLGLDDLAFTQLIKSLRSGDSDPAVIKEIEGLLEKMRKQKTESEEQKSLTVVCDAVKSLARAASGGSRKAETMRSAAMEDNL